MDTEETPSIPSPTAGRPWRGAALLLSFLLLAAPASAVTLAEAITSALALAAQQPRVAALRHEGEAVRAQAGSLSAADPALRLKLLTDRPDLRDSAYEAEAMVDLPLWLPGQRGARRALADSFGGRADALERLLRWEMAGRVREAVWDAMLARGRLDQAKAAIQAARALEETVTKRAEAGELARMELLAARQDTRTREAELAAARLAYERALSTYGLLTGQPRLPEPRVEPAPRVEEPAEVPSDHPLLRDADSALAAARAERGRVDSERRGHPLLSLGGKRTRDGGGADTQNAVQVELSIPFGLASHHAPALAGAERDYTERLTALHRSRLDVERALAAALIERRGAAQALAVAERRASLAEEARRLARRAFDLGELDLEAVLRAGERAREASLDLELRRLETGRSLARLNQALGVIPE